MYILAFILLIFQLLLFISLRIKVSYKVLLDLAYLASF